MKLHFTKKRMNSMSECNVHTVEFNNIVMRAVAAQTYNFHREK